MEGGQVEKVRERRKKEERERKRDTFMSECV